MRAAFRPTVETILAIVMAVVISRTWLLEGYVIPTASMAESLWGTHRRVVCHDCGWTFATGCDIAGRGPMRAVCPNCGFAGNRLDNIPPTPGDRLLVWKTAYTLHPPRRWEPVVFRSPEHPGIVYVKRIVGLPGETVEIRGGDVYINGHLARKPFDVQRAIAMVVNDTRFRAPGVIARWRSDTPQSNWRFTDQGYFSYRPELANENTRIGRMRASPVETASPLDVGASGNWLVYHHHRRLPPTSRHGDEVRSTKTERVPPANYPKASMNDFAGCHVALKARASVGHRTASDHLVGSQGSAVSVTPCAVEDTYGYNQSLPRRVEETHAVGDLMLQCRLRTHGVGRLWLWATNGRDRLAVCIDPRRHSTRWFHDQRPVGSGPLISWPDGEWRDVEMSIIDHQLVVAVDDRELGLPYAFEPTNDTTTAIAAYGRAPETRSGHISGRETSRSGNATRVDETRAFRSALSRPLAIGAEGLEVEIAWLRVLRDVYYTPGPVPIAGSTPTTTARLKRHEFFVLGDNAPVSYDSRAWKCGAGLDKRLLIGRPLTVHLPVRTLSFGPSRRVFRIPDLRRIRYIR